MSVKKLIRGTCSLCMIQLLIEGHGVLVADNKTNLGRNYSVSLKRVETITGKLVPYVHQNLKNNDFVQKLFNENSHYLLYWESLRAVSESLEKPVEYLSVWKHYIFIDLISD